MNILICDDDIQFAGLLEDEFRKYFKRIIDEINIDIVSTEVSEDKDYDICFIDIDLVEGSGIDLAKMIRNRMKDAYIIFVSVREDLVFDTFSVSPMQFVRKRHLFKDLDITFSQLKYQLKNRYLPIIIKDGQGSVVVDVEKINTIISLGHDLIYTTDHKEYTVKGSLKALDEIIKNTSLVQIQKNLIVNISKVQSIKGSKIVYVDGNVYEIGRVYKQYFKSKYEEYYL